MVIFDAFLAVVRFPTEIVDGEYVEKGREWLVVHVV